MGEKIQAKKKKKSDSQKDTEDDILTEMEREDKSDREFPEPIADYIPFNNS